MASPTQWTWIWVSSWSWWWTGKPGVLQSMGLQRVGHNWVTELNWTGRRNGDSGGQLLQGCACLGFCEAAHCPSLLSLPVSGSVWDSRLTVCVSEKQSQSWHPEEPGIGSWHPEFDLLLCIQASLSPTYSSLHESPDFQVTSASHSRSKQLFIICPCLSRRKVCCFFAPLQGRSGCEGCWWGNVQGNKWVEVMRPHQVFLWNARLPLLMW